MTSPRQFERIMGLDVGGKRTGVAISDELGITANPICYVSRGDNDRDDFRTIILRYGVTRLVAGLPSSLSGKEGPQAAEVRLYAESLADDLDLPLNYWDERLTSAMAERALVDSGAKKSKRKEQIDAVAAAIMLQNYLDAQANRKRRGISG